MKKDKTGYTVQLQTKNTYADNADRKALLMQIFVIKLVKCISNPDQLKKVLEIILSFIEPLLETLEFRYLLGMISLTTVLTIGDIAKCAKCSRKRVSKGRNDVEKKQFPRKRNRKKGGGRKKTEQINKWIFKEIIKYVELRSYGPSTKEIKEYTAATLDSIQKFIHNKFNYAIPRSTIYEILKRNNIRLRTNKKLLYGNQHTETEQQKITRHLQFDYIYQILPKIDDPNIIVLSIDCKKKENLGLSGAKGRSYSFRSKPVKCDDHDFLRPLNISTLKDFDDLLDRQEGKAIPYGILDLAMNKCYVNLGIAHDTPEFVVASIERFWEQIRQDHPKARELYLLCDGGGSNRPNSDCFKYHLMLFSRKIGMRIHVVHYPPYRSKFNPIERRAFAPISKKFERSPLYNIRTVKDLIISTTTKKGLRCFCEVDIKVYALKQVLSKEEKEHLSQFYEYEGPTEKMNTKLSYCINGTKNAEINFSLFPAPDTVFDIKHNIDLTREEKEKRRKEAEKIRQERKQERLRKKEEKEKKKAEKIEIEKQRKAAGIKRTYTQRKKKSTQENSNIA